MSVAVNAPKSPVTKGSSGIATATLPNVCKMPGPPAPFVPTPLPNIGKSGDDPKDYSTTVKIEGNPVAIKGASFGSMGDVASKGTGGGIVSSNTQGPCKFIAPGSMDVKIDGGNVQLLGDSVTNNGAASGSPANAATMQGTVQSPGGGSGGSSDGCGAGKHTEVIDYPTVPPEEELPAKRLEAMKNAVEKDAHEIKAAMHNIDAGHIKHGNQLSRNLTQEEIDAKKNGNEQKIFARCTICNQKREIDQSPDETTAVEAKDLKKGWGDAKQKANNIKFAKDGGNVMYKLKETKAKGQLGKEIWEAFKAGGGTPRVEIIPIP